MNPLLRNSLTARQYIPIGDYNSLPSQTEPDQTLSIKQLIERHVQGINVGVTTYEPYYTEEEIPNFEQMDIEELHQYKQFINEQKFKLEDRLREHRKQEKELITRAFQAPSQNTDEGGTRQAPPTPPSTTTPQ